jgi:hypothetical protein
MSIGTRLILYGLFLVGVGIILFVIVSLIRAAITGDILANRVRIQWKETPVAFLIVTALHFVLLYYAVIFTVEMFMRAHQ